MLTVSDIHLSIIVEKDKGKQMLMVECIILIYYTYFSAVVELAHQREKGNCNLLDNAPQVLTNLRIIVLSKTTWWRQRHATLDVPMGDQ